MCSQCDRIFQKKDCGTTNTQNSPEKSKNKRVKQKLCESTYVQCIFVYVKFVLVLYIKPPLIVMSKSDVV